MSDQYIPALRRRFLEDMQIKVRSGSTQLPIGTFCRYGCTSSRYGRKDRDPIQFDERPPRTIVANLGRARLNIRQALWDIRQMKHLLRIALRGLNVVPRHRISFLHIGKTAGTQIADMAAAVNAQSRSVKIIPRPHTFALRDLPADQSYFFSIRSPVARFKSGFYSRKRCGRPRYDIPWNVYERSAYEAFEHANDLAEALFEESDRGLAAVAAMKSLQHAAMDQIDWFAGTGAFLQIRPPIMIVRQEKFATDMGVFLRRIGHEGEETLLTKEERVHANDYSNVPDLSDRAVENLLLWYRQDIEFYRMCERWIEAGATVH